MRRLSNRITNSITHGLDTCLSTYSGHTRRACAIWLLGGATAAMSITPALAQEGGVGRVREKSLEFIQAMAQKEVDAFVKGRASDVDRAYKNYHYLVVPGKLEEVAGYRDAASSDAEKSALTLLHQFLTLHAIRKESAAEVDGAINYLSETEIAMNDAEIPLSNVVNRMSDESDRSTRRQWSFAYKEFLEHVNVYLSQSIHLANVEAKELGFETYLDFLTGYLNFDVAGAQAMAKAVVASTDDMYAELLAAQVKATFGDELSVEDIRFYDMPVIWGMSRLDDAAKPNDVFKIASKTFQSAGIKLDDGSAGDISYTAASSPNARNGIAGYFDNAARNSFTVGGKPMGTIDALGGTLAAAGRMVYHAKAGGSYFEHHFLGDPSLGFGVGYLFASLVGNPAWLKEHTKLSDDQIADAVQAAAYRRIFEAREAAVRILFLPQIYNTEVRQPGELFESVAEPIRGWGHTEVDRVTYLQADDNFECVARLRGIILAAGLEKALKDQHGDEWFKKKDVGKTLATIWSSGSQESSEEVAKSLDVPGFDPALFVAQLQSMMGK